MMLTKVLTSAGFLAADAGGTFAVNDNIDKQEVENK